MIDKDIEEKEKNEFDEPKEIDVKGLLVEEDINKEPNPTPRGRLLRRPKPLPCCEDRFWLPMAEL